MAGSILESMGKFVGEHAQLTACLVVVLVIVIVLLVARERGWLFKKNARDGESKDDSKSEEAIDDLLEQIES